MSNFTLSITSDEFQWKIVRTTKAESGKYSETVLGHYPSVEALKKAIVEKGLRLHGIDDLVSAKAEILSLISGVK